MLDREVRSELRSLSKDTADVVARHLVATGRLLDQDPTAALNQARAARALAGRVGSVREAAGLAAYAAGEWAEAMAELRTARRITGRPDHLHVMADCERALDRPERALSLGDDPEVRQLSPLQRAELIIVLAGARRDMGQPEAAVLMLAEPAASAVGRGRAGGRRAGSRDVLPWAARMCYAYADALLSAGRSAEALEWFQEAVDVDGDGATDADERLLELTGVVLEDLQVGEEPDSEADPLPLA